MPLIKQNCATTPASAIAAISSHSDRLGEAQTASATGRMKIEDKAFAQISRARGECTPVSDFTSTMVKAKQSEERIANRLPRLSAAPPPSPSRAGSSVMTSTPQKPAITAPVRWMPTFSCSSSTARSVTKIGRVKLSALNSASGRPKTGQIAISPKTKPADPMRLRVTSAPNRAVWIFAIPRKTKGTANRKARKLRQKARKIGWISPVISFASARWSV